jgi:hypothetical protein
MPEETKRIVHPTVFRVKAIKPGEWTSHEMAGVVERKQLGLIIRDDDGFSLIPDGCILRCDFIELIPVPQESQDGTQGEADGPKVAETPANPVAPQNPGRSGDAGAPSLPASPTDEKMNGEHPAQLAEKPARSRPSRAKAPAKKSPTPTRAKPPATRRR